MADIRMLFGEYRRNRREEELLAQRAAGIQQALGAAPQTSSDGSGVGPPTAGVGLLSDPTNLNNQLQFGAALEGLPGGGGLGLLSNSLEGARQSGQAEANRGQSDIESQRRAQVQREGQALQYDATLRGQDLQQGQFDSTMQFNIGQAFGGPPGGAAPDIKTRTGTYLGQTPRGYEELPVTGGQVWNDGRDTISGLTDALGDFTQIFQILENTGSGRALSPTTRATLGALNASVIAHVGALNDLGTLQPADVERIREVLPKIEGLGDALFNYDPASKAALQVYYNKYLNDMIDWEARTRYWPNMEDMIPDKPPGTQ